MVFLGATRRTQVLIWLCLLTISLTAHGKTGPSALQHSVVKIYTTSTPFDYFTPWRLMNSRQASGSGAVIHGNRILTNAHVVADASYIQVQKHGQATRFTARVEMVAHEADLALLVIDDRQFFEGVRALKIGELPEPMQQVSVYGYPFGGNTLSITRGVLSRVEHQSYAHGGGFFLAGQIDAAINPGNSGGPVIVDDRVVGVVMQANTGAGAENLGYFVPPSVIRHVLKDVEDGRYHGFADPGFRTQNLDSPAMRDYYAVDRPGQGVLVVEVFKESAASGVLEVGDVILALNDHPIADDSTIEFSADLRTSYKYVIDQLQPGEQLRIQLIRGGNKVDLTMTIPSSWRHFDLVLPEQFEQPPDYLIYGGVVFVPLNMNLIKRWGNNWNHKAPIEFLSARGERSTLNREQAVVALKVLAADVNLGYHDWSNWLVEKVNGETFSNFSEFCRKLAGSAANYTVFSDERGYQMIIDRQMAMATEERVLTRYRVPRSGTCDSL